MSTVMTWQTKSISSDATEQLAEKLGKRLRGGEVIVLASDLGGGKTTFVKGLARGFGSQDTVASPSFTISREYESGDKIMHHFDFYRLHEPGILAHELKDMFADDAVVVIEWADIVKEVLPEGKLTVQIRATGDTERLLTFEYAKELAYLVEGL